MIEYQQACVKLESTSWHEPNRRLLHCAMGLVTECGELYDHTDNVNYLEELGDIMWYVAVGCDTLEITIQEAMESCHDFTEDDPLTDLILDPAEIMDILKKGIFYGRVSDTPRIVYLFGRIALNVEVLAKDVDATLDKVTELNLAKLHRRYKKGTFSEAEAVNRDVKNELGVYS